MADVFGALSKFLAYEDEKFLAHLDYTVVFADYFLD